VKANFETFDCILVLALLKNRPWLDLPIYFVKRNASQTHRKRISNVSQTHRKRNANASQTHRKRSANVSQTHRKRIANAAQTYLKRIANASQTHRKRIANASQTQRIPLQIDSGACQQERSRMTQDCTVKNRT
jgi:hypothetical protein